MLVVNPVLNRTCSHKFRKTVYKECNVTDRFVLQVVIVDYAIVEYRLVTIPPVIGTPIYTVAHKARHNLIELVVNLAYLIMANTVSLGIHHCEVKAVPLCHNAVCKHSFSEKNHPINIFLSLKSITYLYFSRNVLPNIP